VPRNDDDSRDGRSVTSMCPATVCISAWAMRNAMTMSANRGTPGNWLSGMARARSASAFDVVDHGEGKQEPTDLPAHSSDNSMKKAFIGTAYHRFRS
jgi:hypothetical protein